MRLRAFRFLGSTFALIALTGASGAAPLPYPSSAPGSVVDTYFGTSVPDPYRWLENPNDPAVKTWAAAQTNVALDYLTTQPTYAVYKQRIRELARTSTQRFALRLAGGYAIYVRQTPPQPQPQLVVRRGLGSPERVLFDPMRAGSPPPAIETIAVSQDGSKVAFTTQAGGSENETIHVVDTASGRMLPDTIAHAGGGTSPVAIVWDGDGRGFLHTQWPRNADGSYPAAGILIYHHAVGEDPAKDVYVFGKGQSPKVEYGLSASNDGRVQALTASDGDGVHASIFMRTSGATFTRVATPAAGIGDSGDRGGAFVGHAFYAIAKGRHSNGELVALVPGGTFATAKVIVPAGALVIQSIVPVENGFLTADIDGGDGSARLFHSNGALIATLPIPPVSTITALAGDPAGGPIVVGYTNYTSPDRWLAYDRRTNALTPTGIATTSTADFSKIAVERVFVPSLDGRVKIPLEIVHARDIPRDGTAPTVVYAYGAYGIITQPYFDSRRLAWLERGGVFAQAMIRGGGEYGDAWHEAARLSTKTVSSDDLAACAQWLGAHGFGNAEHIGIWGGSAGGFLMGLALTRNPSLYRAVDAEVGIFDLLRVELTPNGKYNTPEFGTVTDPKQFGWMLEQSPYHKVMKGTNYPAVLMTTGENDPRVDPYMSRKMIAQLQANSASGNPLLLIQRAGQGHGIGNSFDQRVEEMTDDWTFFDSQLRSAPAH